MRAVDLFLKRVMDLAGGILGIIILSPLFVAIAAAIKATSKGPVIFRHERLGKGGKPFYIYKFRTMVLNAENLGTGIRVGDEDDPRITKAGRFLRAASLDELPQLFNCVKGDMSLVGPRPPAVYHPYDGYDNYPGWAKKRFEMRPGITGLAQVTVRNSVPWDERIKVDNEYIDEFSIRLDIKILLLTVARVLGRKDIYANKPEEGHGRRRSA